ncbi:DUF4823 domain-containing protein [Agaribacterium haliotis]|uniref:DUF4823 domain-containing protein n=1 Tax=Agaribacterium haliotis TaxID=2013869 RepID=UPI000BB5939C|nr:DUF4823 domain-containing protein [Agaribacterium haliotis]
MAERYRTIYLVFILVSMPLLLSACTAHYTQQLWQQGRANLFLAPSHSQNKSLDWRLHHSARIAVRSAPEPVDATIQRAALRLERELTASLRANFSHSRRLEPGPGEGELNPLFAAYNQGFEFLIVSDVLKLNDQLSSWTEMQEGKHQHPGQSWGADELLIQLNLYETYSGKLLDSRVIRQKSSLFNSLDDSAADLIEPALRDYVRQLGGARSS